MREGGTVKAFLDTLNEMRTVYPFKDEDTRISVLGFNTLTPDCLSVTTTDENTGVFITMSKDFRKEV